MPMSKREQARIDRELIATLTDACETAKALIPGFVWLTHRVDYQRFPDSLHVVWVFDSEAEKTQAAGQLPLIQQLTATALEQADVNVANISRHLSLDSEQACQRSHGGNWQQRLARH